MSSTWTRVVSVLGLALLVGGPSAPAGAHAEDGQDVVLRVKQHKARALMEGGLKHIRAVHAKRAAARRAASTTRKQAAVRAPGAAGAPSKAAAPRPIRATRQRPNPLRDDGSAVRPLDRAVLPAAREAAETIAALGTNVLVNDTSAFDWDRAAGQNEPAIAAWGSYVIAAWNDGAGYETEPPGDLIGYGYSVDGGLTWVDGGDVPKPAGSLWTSDPVLTVNEKTGEFFFCALIDPIEEVRNGLGVSRARFVDSQVVWDGPHFVRNVSYGSDFIDKPWIAADSLTGRVYVSYTHFTAITDSIVFQRSEPGTVDQYWTKWGPMLTMNRSDAAGYVQGSRVAVGPAGEVYVTWAETNIAAAFDFMRIRKSTNQGQSFDNEVAAATFYDNFGSGAPNFNRNRGITFPAIAVDRSTGGNRGRVYLAWNESVNWYADLATIGTAGSINESEPNNTAATADPFVPGQTINGSFDAYRAQEDWFSFPAVQGNTYVFWCDTIPRSYYTMRVLCDDQFTRLSRAGDDRAPPGGFGFTVWTAPKTATFFVRMFHDTISAGGSSQPGVWRIRTAVHVPQGFPNQDRARDQRDVFVTSSINGTSWTAPVLVNDDPPYLDNWLPEIAVSTEGRVWSIWYDWRDAPAARCGGESNIYVARSTNGGTSWGTVGRVSDTNTAWTDVNSNIAPNQGDYLALYANQQGVYAAWTDGRLREPDIYASTLFLALTPVLASLTGAHATAARVSLSWHVPSSEVRQAIVYRKERAVWEPLASLRPDGSGNVVFEDRAVTAGAQYTYRLGLLLSDDPVERFSGEVQVRVPAADAFGLDPIHPNPARRELWVQFTLPAAGSASLRVLDAGGRVVREYEVGSLGPGRHTLDLSRGQRLPPGVYLVRLVRGSESATRRVVVLQ